MEWSEWWTMHLEEFRKTREDFLKGLCPTVSCKFYSETLISMNPGHSKRHESGQSFEQSYSVFSDHPFFSLPPQAVCWCVNNRESLRSFDTQASLGSWFGFD